MSDPTPVLHPSRLFHSGIVVADIDKAMAELSASHGLTWRGGRPSIHHLYYFDADQEPELRIAFCIEGPPHIELIEAKEGTIWPPKACGLHHLCYWSPEAEATASSLEAQGYQRLSGRPGSAGGYFRSPSGLVIEVLPEDYYQHLAGWLARPSSSRA
jgi:catechol 2,3-dioxygenase-like lactoylglutathione lyase family enzyme